MLLEAPLAASTKKSAAGEDGTNVEVQEQPAKKSRAELRREDEEARHEARKEDNEARREARKEDNEMRKKEREEDKLARKEAAKKHDNEMSAKRGDAKAEREQPAKAQKEGAQEKDAPKLATALLAAPEHVAVYGAVTVAGGAVGLLVASVLRRWHRPLVNEGAVHLLHNEAPLAAV